MKIVICGCSYSYGWTSNLKTSIGYKLNEYGLALTKKLNAEYINIAKPGASNYAIVKQLQHAIDLKPDLILFNTTSPRRFDFLTTDEILTEDVTIKDFCYKFKNEDTAMFNGNIQSLTYSTIEEFGNSNMRYKEISKFLNLYTDRQIRIDQDRIILKGGLLDLQRSNIPYLGLEFFDYFQDEPHMIHIPWEPLCKQFPMEHDPVHWSEDGHLHLADLLYEKIRLMPL